MPAVIWSISRKSRLRRGSLQAEGDSTMKDIVFRFVDAGDI